MGDDRGGFAPTTPGCRLWIWRLHGRRANVVRRRWPKGPSRARHNRGSEPRLIGAGKSGGGTCCRGVSLEDVFIKKELPFSLKKLAYLLATSGI